MLSALMAMAMRSSSRVPDCATGPELYSLLQSLDRIHRLGLREDQITRITVLAAAETIDDLVQERLRVKLAFMAGVLADPAVLALSDLDEEPTQAVGMDASDRGLLARYLSGGSPS